MKDHLDALCREAGAVGAGAALFSAEGLLYRYDYGWADRERALPSGKSSLYMIGSNTKLLTALGLLQQAEAGRLRLDGDIRDYLPDFSVPGEAPITVRQLLGHRAGLVSDFFQLTQSGGHSFREVLPLLRQTPLIAPPGEMFAYSNVSYCVLGLLLEALSGEDYGHYVRAHLAGPLGMELHFLQTDGERKACAPRLAACYDLNGQPAEDFTAALSALPAGTHTYSTLEGLAALGQCFLRRGAPLVSPESMAAMEHPPLEDPLDARLAAVHLGLYHNQYRLGPDVPPVYGHGGDTACHHAMLHYCPGLGVGVATVTNSARAEGLSRTLGLELLRAFAEHRGYTVTGNFAEDLPGEDFHPEAYVTGGGLLELLSPHEGQLQGKTVPLTPEIGGSYRWGDSDLYVKQGRYRHRPVLLGETRTPVYQTLELLGAPLMTAPVPENFRLACGRYVSDRGPMARFRLTAELALHDHLLHFTVQTPIGTLPWILRPLSSTEAVIQGLGWKTGERVTLTPEGLNYSGLLFRPQP